MNEALKRLLSTIAPNAGEAPRAALINVIMNDLGQPRAGLRSAIVSRGETVVWSGDPDDRRRWRVVFRSMEPAEAIDPAMLATIDSAKPCCRRADSVEDHGPLALGDPPQPSQPRQTTMLRISPDARQGVYRYGLVFEDGLVPDVEPPLVEFEEELVVLFGPRVEDDSEPVR